MANEKILICDDEPGMRLVLTNVLKPEGYDVLVAEDGVEALAKVRSERPQLMFLDMRLPDMDGLEILAEVKKLHPQLPVVVLSGFADIDSAVDAVKIGAFDYLSKPFRVDDVKKMALKALGTPAVLKENTEPKLTFSTEPIVQPEAAPKKKSRLNKKTFSIVGAALLLVAGGGAWKFRSHFAPAPPDKEFTITYSNPTALCFSGKEKKVLWSADWMTSTIYKHKLDEKLSVAKKYKLAGGHPTGLAWDGKNLWSSNSWEHKIYKHNMDKTLSVAEEYPSPGPEPAGLHWDGAHLWVCDFKEAKFYRMKIVDGKLSVLNAYDSPGSKPVAIFSRSDALWSADAGTNRIYEHAKDATLSVQESYAAAPYEERKVSMSGMAWDGKSLWTCADQYSSVHRQSLKNLKPIK